MELRTHDLIEVTDLGNLLTELPLPDWAVSALSEAPYVVVRRAVEREGFIPVGIRGKKRGERFAAWLKFSASPKIITPEMLVYPQQWKTSRLRLNKVLISLKKITPSLNVDGLHWGPTGSAAFELATGVKALKKTSDLDLVIRLRKPLSVRDAALILAKLNAESLIRLDVQLDTPLGGVSLSEFAKSKTVLVKTPSGPVIAQRTALWKTSNKLKVSA